LPLVDPPHVLTGVTTAVCTVDEKGVVGRARTRYPDVSPRAEEVDMALLEGVFGSWGGVAFGVGAAVVAPAVLPAIGSAIRPVAKALVKGALVVTDRVTELTAETREQVGDLVAEVMADNAKAETSTSRGTTKTVRP
jgi:hypothetical protein